MTAQLLEALGGLGLFLLGLLVLTEGLRQLAGDALHRALFRFTRSPTSGAATGALVTAILQSSSVTTTMTVGFVAAGTLTFAQALGILFGANVGTTITGWMVALLGFEYDVVPLMQPVLVVGVLLRLFGRGQVAQAGWSLAGFALIFIGLEGLQGGMAGFQGQLTPADFPDDTVTGRLLLIGIGAVVTIVTQSSSAGVATALVAVDAGAISFAQAAAMVIGMDAGTTSTTAVAAIGGSATTRRTGYSHVVYNLMTAVGAFLLLGPYTWVLDRVLPGGAASHAPLALVGFHTAFNGLGVLVVLPFTRPFARLMTRLVPESDARPDPSERLEASLLASSTVASSTLLGVVRELSIDLFEILEASLDPDRERRHEVDRLERLERAVDRARRYSDEIVGIENSPEAQRTLLASMHMIDHLDRLGARCGDRVSLRTVREDARLRELAADVRAALRTAAVDLRGGTAVAGEAALHAVRDRVRAERRPYREAMIHTAPRPEIELEDVLLRLDAMRWLHRSTYHAWRIALNLVAASGAPTPVDRDAEHPSRAEQGRDDRL